MKAEAVNNGFVPTFEELLREVWIVMEHVNNQTGANPTDDAVGAHRGLIVALAVPPMRSLASRTAADPWWRCSISLQLLPALCR